MHSSLTRAALPVALLTCLALAPASAQAAKKSDWLYDVTVTAELTEKWSFHEESHMGDAVEPCDRVQEAAGMAKIQLRSRRPTRVMVMRGPAGRPPMLNVGTGEGVPMTGTYQRDGKDETRHSGPKCGPANPPFDQPVSGCGLRPMKADWALVSQKRGTVYPQMIMDDIREDCPSGPPNGLEWKNDLSPQLSAVTQQAPPSKFYGTKQFTLHGAKSFTGTVTPVNEPHFQRFGQAEATWQWETTYRLVSKKKRKRR